MKMLDTILVPVVLGPGGDAAVETGLMLAQSFQSKLLLLHVIPDRVYPLMAEDPGIRWWLERLRETYGPYAGL